MEETIKALPKRKNIWIKDESIYNFQGHWYFDYVLKGLLSAREEFKAQSSDIFLCSSPKTGTTWLKALAFAIVTRKRFNDATNPLLSTMPHNCIPFLEVDFRQIQNNTDFSLFATHSPYASLPESIIDSNCKIVYIYRSIKDTIVSYYHFMLKLNKTVEEMPFKNIIQEYCEGFSLCGPYWDHILEYWKASMERPERILLLKYEDLQRDPSSNVKRLAEFLGYPFSSQEEESGIVENIINLCSFKNLSYLEVNKSGHYYAKETFVVENQFFFRKGEAGDWENYFTKEMKEKIDKIMDEKLSGTGLVLNE